MTLGSVVGEHTIYFLTSVGESDIEWLSDNAMCTNRNSFLEV